MSSPGYGRQGLECNKPNKNLHVAHEDKIIFGELDSSFGRYMKN